jgi:DNA-binding transcriptional LysR family regulator
MKIRDLLDVKAICEAGSIRKAAEQLGVTQPTLGARIERMEGQLGASLFDRSRGHSQPTDLARFIAARVAAVADESQRISREVMRYASGQGGRVRIGLGEAPAHSLMAEIIAGIAARQPQLSIAVLTAPTGQLAAHLLDGEIDFAICHPIEGQDEAIAGEPLLESRIVVVAHPDHPFCARPPASLGELHRTRLALPYLEPRYVAIVRQQFGIDVDAQPGLTLCSNLELLLGMLRKDPGLASTVPEFTVSRELAAGQLEVVRTPVPFRHLIHLHTRRDAFPLPAVAWVGNVVREAFVGIRERLGQ